jgi:hypothetical protein
MTPNQIEGIGRAVAELLTEAHAGGCEPSAHALEVRRWFGPPRGRWYVEAYAITPEGGSVILSALVAEDGSRERLDALWPEPGNAADPLARPGVRIDADGQPLYSSEWLT